jgi:hypothetical protein
VSLVPCLLRIQLSAIFRLRIAVFAFDPHRVETVRQKLVSSPLNFRAADVRIFAPCDQGEGSRLADLPFGLVDVEIELLALGEQSAVIFNRREDRIERGRICEVARAGIATAVAAATIGTPAASRMKLRRERCSDILDLLFGHASVFAEQAADDTRRILQIIR